MKIAIVSSASTDSVGGLSAYMRLITDNLRQRGIEVATAARFVTPDPPSFTDYAASEAPGATSRNAIPTVVFRPKPTYIGLLKHLYHMVNRPVLREIAKIIYVAAYQPALRAALPVEIDHLHYVGTGQELLGFAVLAEARRRGIGMSNWPAVHPGLWGDGPLDIDLFRRLNTIFCQSAFEYKHLRAKGVPEDQLVTTGLGPATELMGDAARFRAAHDLGNRKLVLFIGRKDRGKGYHAVCAAMPAVLTIIPDACLVAVGPSREPPYPEVPAHGFLDLGMASEEDKADALAACDVFCMPSEADAFGIVYVEAWANHKPVIGGLAPAVRELITEGTDGFCVSQDPNDVAAALIKVLADDTLRQRLGEEGYALQQEKYNWKVVTDTHVAVFEKAMRKHSGAHG